MWNSVAWEDAHHDWLLITSVWSYWKFHKLVFQMFLDKLKKKNDFMHARWSSVHWM